MKPDRPSISTPLAIIGIDCIFPKADVLRDYWSNIRNRVDAIEEVPETHWRIEDFYNKNPRIPDKTYARRGGFISPIDFDPMEFAIAPNILEATDTSQLLGLVVAGRALDNAGYGLDRDFDKRRTSVILGVTGTLELVIPLGARLGYPRWRQALKECGADEEFTNEVVKRISDSYVDWQGLSFPGLLGNVVAGRIANHYDLGGTNCVVDAACGSSLSALNLAALELISGRSDVVVTGGVDTFNDIFMYMCFSKTPALSPTGDSRPFDHKCDGTIIGEGLGMIVLKRLEDAKRDGDRIYAVIQGVGTSSDGKGTAIFAPKADGQVRALRNAYEQTGISPRTIELLEAHGTGTKVGDITEISALCEVYREAGSDNMWCALGSVKSQIGHTKAAAGIAGLIKTALSLYYKVLPPTIKVEKPMDVLAASDTPFYVNTELRPWMPSKDHPRRGAVSSFGFGGSNYHCILEEFGSEKTEIDWDNSVLIAAFSSPSEAELMKKLDLFKTSSSWSEMCFQTAGLLKEFDPGAPVRMVLVLERKGQSPEKVIATARKLLEKNAGKKNWSSPDGIYFGTGSPSSLPAVLFPGQGAQYPGMLRDLVCQFPMMLDAVSAANDSFAENRADGISSSLADLIYPRPAFESEEKALQEKSLRDTRSAQPALGAVSYGALQVLKYFGLTVQAYAGHSYGELTALAAANRLTPGELHKLSALRGNLMAGRSGDLGSMLAVQDDLSIVEEVLEKNQLDLVIANKNAPKQAVLSGRTDEITRAAGVFTGLGIRNTQLSVAAAFHSSIIADARIPFAEALSHMEMPSLGVPVYSNTTGALYPDSPGEARDLLANQLAQPVEFVREIRAMYEAGIRTFVEIGPGSRLTGLVKAILSDETDYEALALDSSGGKRSGITDLARLLANLSALGYGIALHLWNPMPEQKSSSQQKKARMTVSICGMNYVRPRVKKSVENKKVTPPRSSAVGTAKADVTMSSHENNPAKDSVSNPSPLPQVSGGMDSSTLVEALRITRSNLAALQAVQEQTALLHQQFLANQESAMQSLRMLLEQQQMLIGASLGQLPTVSGSPPTPVQLQKIPSIMPLAKTGIPAVSSGSAVQAAGSSVTLPSVSKLQERAGEMVVSQGKVSEVSLISSSSPVSKVSGADFSGALLEVVAEKTGYPTDMLELDMTLDTDLGIDSIKRVEILSSLQDRVSGLQPIRPEQMGSIRTLRDILSFAGDSAVSSSTVSGSSGGAEAVVTVTASGVSAGDSSRKLLEVISEKTGYPEDMLEMDMTLDSDLGIDSIKRVEIFSSLQERIPGLPPVKPDLMGSLRTLRDISEYISAGVSPGGAATSASSVESASSSVQGMEKLGEGFSEARVSTILLELVSEKTGYPIDMLELGMSLDSDLGIDSIKRVEIFSSLKDQISEMPAVSPDLMNSIRTLGDISAYILESLKKTVNAAAEPGFCEQSSIDSGLCHSNFSTIDDVIPSCSCKRDEGMIQLHRKVLACKVPDSGKPREMVVLPRNSVIRIIDDGTELSRRIGERLKEKNFTVKLVSADDEASCDSSENLGGLLVLSKISDLPENYLLDIFRHLQESGRALRKAGQESGAFFVTLSRMDGSFGLRGIDTMSSALSGGLAGLSKTAGHEWKEVSCKALDLDRNYEDYERASELIVEELFLKGPMEVGIDGEGVRVLESVDLPLTPGVGALPLSEGDVVVITGGARGVTAECAESLARASQGIVLALFGRTSCPTPEVPELAALTDEKSIKQYLMKTSGTKMTPRTLEDAYHAVTAGREIRSTLDKLERLGARACYYSVDIRDRESIRKTLTEIRTTLGSIRGVIHGAGVLADKFIDDKTPDEFLRVYSTKVDGLFNLLDETREDDLRVMVLFSSSTGRFGRMGQVDYAVANEVLNKAARVTAVLRPGCRVLSMNWGPWDGGMVTPALKKVFESEGVGIIPLRTGADHLVREICAPGNEAVEVVILGPVGDGSPGISRETSTDFSVVLEKSLSVEDFPFLRSHVIDGKAVFPVAMMIEVLAHGALLANPGLHFIGFNNLRVLRGIKLNAGDSLVYRILSGKLKKIDSVFSVPVELLTSSGGSGFVRNASAEILLASQVFGDERKPFGAVISNGSRFGKDIYGTYLFHGPALQGIQSVGGVTRNAISGIVSPAPHPREFMKTPFRSSWTSDPLILDSSFQLMILWSIDTYQAPCLPCFIEKYRQFSLFCGKQTEVTAVVTGDTDSRAVADIEFVDSKGTLIARIEGYECTIDANLKKTFRLNRLEEGSPGSSGSAAGKSAPLSVGKGFGMTLNS